MREISLRTIGNSLAGIVGGIGSGQLLSALGMLSAVNHSNGLDIASMISNVAIGGIGGAILLAVVGIIKKAIYNE